MATATVAAGNEEFPFVAFMVKKIRNGWGKVKNFFSPRAVHEVTDEGTVTTRQGALWLLYQLTKVPHWLGIGLEFSVKVVMVIISFLVGVLLAAITLLLIGVWGSYTLLEYVILSAAALLSIGMSLPYTAMRGGKDAVSVNWGGFRERFLRPFRRLRSSFRLAQEDVAVEETTQEQVSESMTIAHTQDGQDSSKSSASQPKGRPTPARRDAHRQISQALKDGS